MTGRMFVRLRVYALPVPLFIAMYALWRRWSGDALFTAFVMWLPVVYGYVIPGIGTNLLHKWRFTGTWVVGRYYAHHGFLYAANMTPLLLIAFLGTPRAALSVGTVVRILLCTATLHGFVFWIHDLMLVRYGMVEINNRPAAEGRSPAEIVTHYAPLCFFCLGWAYAAGSVLAFKTFVVDRQTTWAAVAWVWLAGIALTFVIPSLAYRWTERRPGERACLPKSPAYTGHQPKEKNL